MASTMTKRTEWVLTTEKNGHRVRTAYRVEGEMARAISANLAEGWAVAALEEREAARRCMRCGTIVNVIGQCPECIKRNGEAVA